MGATESYGGNVPVAVRAAATAFGGPFMSKLGVAAWAIAAILASPSAQATTFTFADANGSPYCNFIRLNQTSGLAGGVIDGTACTPPGVIAGAGVFTAQLGTPGKLWSFGFATGAYPSLFLLDEKALTWTLYAGAKSGGYALQPLESGTLLPGKQPAKPGAKSVLSALGVPPR